MRQHHKCLRGSKDPSKQIKKRKSVAIVGWITSTEFQTMFNVARKATSSDPHSPDYTLWKSVAKRDYVPSIMSVLLSLLFVYGFITTR